MKWITTGLVTLIAFGGLVSAASAAGATTAQKFANCAAAAEVAFGTADEKANVSLQGVRKAGKQLRLRVSTPEGEGIAVLCDVDRSSGELLALTPPHKAGTELALSQDD